MLQLSVAVLDEPLDAEPLPHLDDLDEEHERHEDAVLMAAIKCVDDAAVDLFRRIREIDALQAIYAGRRCGNSKGALKDPVALRIDLIVRLGMLLGNDVSKPSVLRHDLDGKPPHDVDPLDRQCAQLQRQELVEQAGAFNIEQFLGEENVKPGKASIAVALAVDQEPDELLPDRRSEPRPAKAVLG